MDEYGNTYVAMQDDEPILSCKELAPIFRWLRERDYHPVHENKIWQRSVETAYGYTDHQQVHILDVPTLPAP